LELLQSKNADQRKMGGSDNNEAREEYETRMPCDDARGEVAEELKSSPSPAKVTDSPLSTTTLFCANHSRIITFDSGLDIA